MCLCLSDYYCRDDDMQSTFSAVSTGQESTVYDEEDEEDEEEEEEREQEQQVMNFSKTEVPSISLNDSG